MEISTKFYENLNDLLIENNLKPKNLADILGMGNATINRYKNGVRVPTIEYLVKIADYFNCSTDYLLGLEDDPQHTKDFLTCPPFAERIKYLITYFRCSSSYFYKNTDISKARFYEWKKGKGIPNIDNITKIASLFGCSVDFVLGRSNA